MVLVRAKLLYSEKSSCNRAKVVVFGQKVVVFGQKVVVFGHKVVVVGQK